MNDLIQILQSQMTGDVIKKLSKDINAPADKTQAAVEGVLSSMIGAIGKNVSNPSGAEALMSAVKRDHDGSVLNDVMGFLSGNAKTGNSNAFNASGILKHVLGSQQSSMIEQISKKSGLNSSQITELFMKLAPLVMGALGKTNNQNTGKSGGDLLSTILSAGQALSSKGSKDSKGGGGFLGELLNQQKKNVMNDMISKGAKSILGNLLKK
jgi:hypothetical protein